MTIKSETSLHDFNFWGNAHHNVELLTCAQLDAIEQVLEDYFPEGLGETELNDLFAFEFEEVCSWVGLVYDGDEDIVKDEAELDDDVDETGFNPYSGSYDYDC